MDLPGMRKTSTDTGKMDQTYEKQRMMVIVNPVSGQGEASRRWLDIERTLRDLRVDFEYCFTEYPRHAVSLARKAAEEGYKTVVAVGGDGTVYEITNGIMSARTSRLPALGLIPCGRGTDFASSIGIPSDWQIAVSLLASGRRRKVDVVSIEYMDGEGLKTGFFANIAGVGFDSEVIKNANLIKPALSGLMGGRLSYFASFLPALGKLKEKDIEVHLDEKVIRVLAVSVFLANGNYFGGKMRVAPDAVVNDGMLDVIVTGIGGQSPVIDLPPEEPVPGRGRIGKIFHGLRTLSNISRIYAGNVSDDESVFSIRAKKVRLLSDSILLLHADGELIGEAPVAAEVIESALTVIA